MPKQYAREFRRAVCARLVADEKVTSLSKELGVSEGHAAFVEAPCADRCRPGRGTGSFCSPSHGKDDVLVTQWPVHSSPSSRPDLSGCEERVHHRR